MRVLVTGGAGFIGSHLVRALLSKGHEVRVLDNFETGSIANLAEVMGEIELFRGDVQDQSIVHRAIAGVTTVFHQAALPSVPRSIQDPITSTAVNVMGTCTVLKAAVDAGVERVVYAASSSAYGDAIEDIKHESLMPHPLSPYAVAKLTGEHLLQAFSNCYGIETISLRYFNVFGERQDPHSQYSGVIARFCRQMVLGEVPVINGDGTTSRDFTYVSNVVQANLLAAEVPKRLLGSVVNVACGGSVTLTELVNTLNHVLGSQIVPSFVVARPGDIKHSCADISMARELLGYTPSVDFMTGIRRTVRWYQQALNMA